MGPVLPSPHLERTELQNRHESSLRKQCSRYGRDGLTMCEMGRNEGRHHQPESFWANLTLIEFHRSYI